MKALRQFYRMKKLLLPIVSFIVLNASAQSIQVVDSSQSKVSYRGLSVVNDQTAWVSGSRGTIGKTLDGGKSWQWVNPKGFEKRDFRDIEAFDDKTALVMAVDSPGTILKTTDGGISWKTVYHSNISGMFLDAMAFKGDTGICLGDPIDGRFWIITTQDRGTTWTEMPMMQRPQAEDGEACFAASGTNILLVPEPGNLRSAFLTGGKVSKLHLLDISLGQSFGGKVAITQGQTMTGGNSVVWFKDGFVMVGGNYNAPKISDSNMVVMSPQWPTPQLPVPAFNGYASCIEAIADGSLIVCGVPGVSVTNSAAYFKPNQTPSWKSISTQTFHVVQKAKKGDAIYLAGPGGKIGKLFQ